MEEQFGAQQGAEALQFVDELQQDISSFLLLKGRDADILDYLGGVLCYGRPADTDDYRWSDALMEGLLRHPPKKAASGDEQSRPTRPVFGAPPHSSSIFWPARPDSSQLRKCRLQPSTNPEGSVSVSEPDKSDSCGSKAEIPASSSPNSEVVAEASEAAAQAAHAVAVTAAAAAAAGERIDGATVNEHQQGRDCLASLLEFSSCFESGNLRYAVFQPDEELLTTYDLVLDNDVNTHGHTQWFYFSVRGGRRGQRVRFRIINMSKSQSLFRQGMKPVAWSEVQAAADEATWAGATEEACDPLTQGWRYAAENVSYHRSKIGVGSYHTLAFEYTFREDLDTVYFAYCVPYTYSMNCTALQAMERHPVKGKWCRRKRLCYTLGSLSCDVFCVSNWDISRRQKKTVVVSARVHPGESNASWLVHGLLSFLLSHSAEAQALRDNFIWHVVPMLNPDGVVHGNYRCSLAGVDLNRQWRHPMKALHQNVYEMKKMIIKLKKKSDLCMFIDLHGHSRKCGIFSYCCAGFPRGDERHYQVRMYPRLLSLLSPEFAFRNCRWKQGPGKRGTGRVVVAKDIGLVTSYTIEASFFGASMKREGEAPEQEVNSDCEERIEEGATEELQTQKTGKKGSMKENGKMVPFTPAKLQSLGADLARAMVIQHNLGREVWKIRKAHELWEQRLGCGVCEEVAEAKTSQGRTGSALNSQGAPSRNCGETSSGENSRQQTPELSGDSGDESDFATEVEAEDVEGDDGSGSDIDSCEEGATPGAEDAALDFEYEEEPASPQTPFTPDEVQPVRRPRPMGGLPDQCGQDTPSTAAPSSAPSSASSVPSSAPASLTQVVAKISGESLGPRNSKSTVTPKKRPKKKELVRRPIQLDEWLRSPVNSTFDKLGRYSGCFGCQVCASGFEISPDLIPETTPPLGIDANAVLSDLRAAGVPEDEDGSSSGSDSAPSDDNLSKEALSRIGRRLVQRSRRMRRSLPPSPIRRAPSTLKKDSKKEELSKRKSGGSRSVKLVGTKNSDASCRSEAQELKRLVAFGQTTYVPENPQEMSRKEVAIPKNLPAPHIEEPAPLTVTRALPECRTALYPKGNAAISRSLLGVNDGVSGLFLGCNKDRFAFLGEEQKITARLGNRLANEGTALAGMLCIRTAHNAMPAPHHDAQKKSSRNGATSSSSQVPPLVGPAKMRYPRKVSRERFSTINRIESLSSASGSKDHVPRPASKDNKDGLGLQPEDQWIPEDSRPKPESQAAVRNGKRRVPSANDRNGRSGGDIQLPSLGDALQRELTRRERVFEELRQPRSEPGIRRSIASEPCPVSAGGVGSFADDRVPGERPRGSPGRRVRESLSNPGANEISPRGHRRGLAHVSAHAQSLGPPLPLPQQVAPLGSNWPSQRACHV